MIAQAKQTPNLPVFLTTGSLFERASEAGKATLFFQALRQFGQFFDTEQFEKSFGCGELLDARFRVGELHIQQSPPHQLVQQSTTGTPPQLIDLFARYRLAIGDNR